LASQITPSIEGRGGHMNSFSLLQWVAALHLRKWHAAHCSKVVWPGDQNKTVLMHRD